MTRSAAMAGYFRSGLPYVRAGHGANVLIVFQGLMFENKPSPGPMGRAYSFLEEDYTVYLVGRKPGLPPGYSLQDMADDYATMIREEFEPPVDVIGNSTGGSIAHHFAADHPDLLRRLVLHSAAYTLESAGKAVQLRLAQLARQGRWRAAYAAILDFILPHHGVKGVLSRPVVWLVALVAGTFFAPKDPSDLIVTIEAEDKFNFRERLAEITAPTLVVAGDRDPFYSAELFRETAAGIPHARLILYEGKGYGVVGRQFNRDVLAFLREGVQ